MRFVAVTARVEEGPGEGWLGAAWASAGTPRRDRSRSHPGPAGGAGSRGFDALAPGRSGRPGPVGGAGPGDLPGVESGGFGEDDEALHPREAPVAAIEAAKTERRRWQAELDDASDEAQQVLASTHLAASSAVLLVLQEVLEPGTHSEQGNLRADVSLDARHAMLPGVRSPDQEVVAAVDEAMFDALADMAPAAIGPSVRGWSGFEGSVDVARTEGTPRSSEDGRGLPRPRVPVAGDAHGGIGAQGLPSGTWMCR